MILASKSASATYGGPLLRIQILVLYRGVIELYCCFESFAILGLCLVHKCVQAKNVWFV